MCLKADILAYYIAFIGILILLGIATDAVQFQKPNWSSFKNKFCYLCKRRQIVNDQELENNSIMP